MLCRALRAGPAENWKLGWGVGINDKCMMDNLLYECVKRIAGFDCFRSVVMTADWLGKAGKNCFTAVKFSQSHKC